MSNEQSETANAAGAAQTADSQTSLEDTNFLKAGQDAQPGPSPDARLSETGPQTEDAPPQPAEPAPNGHDQASQASQADKVDNLPWPEEVPRDTQGKRPSDNTIDFDKLKEHLPDEVYQAVEGRFRSLYKQTKAQDRHLDQICRDFGSVENFVSVHQEAAAEAQALKAAEVERRQAEAAEQWKAEYKEAFDAGDADKLADLELRKPNAAPEPAAPQGNLDPQAEAQVNAQMQRVSQWAEERDPKTGNFKRPWAQPGHPHFATMKKAFEGMLVHPEINGDVDKALAMLEASTNRRAQQRTRQAAPPPLSGNRDVRTTPNPNQVTLSAEQRVVAERLFGGEPKQAHARYLSGLKKSGMA